MLNLRRHVTKKNNDLDAQLKSEDITRLTKLMIEWLEAKVLLEKGKVFKQLSWASLKTRAELLDLVYKKEISFKVCQLEVRRRKKMKI